jgi:broad specificity phosphatase PhoE
MSWPKRLVLVRHAESEGNIRTAEERAVFPTATYAYRLTKRGRAQAARTGDYLRQRFGGFDFFYTSYYERARETMRIMYPEAHVYEDARLAEANRGVWHTMTTAEVEARFPGERERRERENLYHYRPLGGENWPDIELRVHSFLGTIARDGGGRGGLVVVHGHWLILLQRLMHHFSIEEAMHRYRERITENASVTVYERRGLCHPRLELVEENIVPWRD